MNELAKVIGALWLELDFERMCRKSTQKRIGNPTAYAGVSSPAKELSRLVSSPF